MMRKSKVWNENLLNLMEILTPLTLWLWINNVVTFELSVLIKHYWARLSENLWITFLWGFFYIFFPPLTFFRILQFSSLLFTNADMFLHAFIPWINQFLYDIFKIAYLLIKCLVFFRPTLVQPSSFLLPLWSSEYPWSFSSFVGFSPSIVLSRLRSYAVPYYTVCGVLHQWAKTTGCSKDGHKWWFELVPSWSLEKV